MTLVKTAYDAEFHISPVLLRIAALSCLLVAAGCGDSGRASPASSATPLTTSFAPPTDSSRPLSNRIEIAPGVTLEAGPQGALPVSLRWVVTPGDWPEAVAVQDGVVYVAADTFYAFRLSDGRQIWSAHPPDGNALGGSGGVGIGTRGGGEIRAWAPYEYDITVRQSDGHVVQFNRGVGEDPPEGWKPFPVPEPERFTIEMDLERIVGRNPDGSVGWQVTVEEPMADELPPIGVPGGVVITTSSGHVLMLDYR